MRPGHRYASPVFRHINNPVICTGSHRAFRCTWDPGDIEALEQLLESQQHHVAAIVLQPIVQGAGGMFFYSPQYLRSVRDLCDKYDILLIADEIATGFGRSGKLFACEHANISPDIMCIGKALTGGYMTMAATLCTQKIAQTISASGLPLMHGPTFMANPLACAVASASIEVLFNSDWQTSVNRIEQQLRQELAPCQQLAAVKSVRVLGAIGVVELENQPDAVSLQSQLTAQGVWIRPFGKLVYIMPPYIISQQELSQLTKAIYTVCATQN